MGYFAPPSNETWRLVDAANTADALTIDWLPPDARATTWGVAVRSVISKRTRTGAPDVTDAMATALIPLLDDGRTHVVQIVLGDRPQPSFDTQRLTVAAERG